jgi:SAM-dependent methyltransferase
MAADFFGTQDQDDAMSQTFTPGFKTNEKLKLSNVNFSYLSADAYHIPLDDESVSIIFDRLGVLHHSTDSFTTGKVLTEKLLKILKHWSTKLKPNGSILVDASDLPRGPEKIDSTTDKLETYMNIFINHNWNIFVKNIEAMSLKPSFIGSGSNRLWRLQKKGL